MLENLLQGKRGLVVGIARRIQPVCVIEVRKIRP